MEQISNVMKIFPQDIRRLLESLSLNLDKLQEIRLRCGRPLILICQNREYMVGEGGRTVDRPEEAFTVTKTHLKDTMEYLSSYSMYAFEDEIRQGFLTIQGGHRVGLAGKIVADGMNIRTMKSISFLNIRLSHEIKGCAEPLLPYLYDGQQMRHTLLFSPPRGGKTTILRDLIRLISDGNRYAPGKNVGVVDERSELGACYLGIPQNDLGMRTDILDCCPKAVGMMMLIRSMSPEVIAVDEIGSREDMEAIEYAIHCGCRMLATVHGSTVEELMTKPAVRQLLDSGCFERLILPDQGKAQIFDGKGKKIYGI